MKIPNYESCPKKDRSINNFIREDFRILVCGQSGSGKTNTVLHILIKPLVYYDLHENEDDSVETTDIFSDDEDDDDSDNSSSISDEEL